MTKFTPKTLAEFYRELDETGGVIKYFDNKEWGRNKLGPDLECDIDRWKIEKPQIELEQGDYFFNSQEDVFLATFHLTSIDINNMARKGLLRSTEKAAQLSANRVIRTNRLSALASQLGVEKEFKEGDSNASIFYDYELKKYLVAIQQHSKSFEKVYMTPKGAKQICDILNEGRFTLELSKSN